MHTVVSGLHNDALQYWEKWREKQDNRRAREIEVINNLQECIRELWSFASLEPFGSWATGLRGAHSDIDLVVCFEDDILLRKTPTSRHDLLKKLAAHLELHAQNIIKIDKVLLHTRVPLIKASAELAVLNSDTEEMELIRCELDISIDGPEHSGLATTSLTQAMLKALPGLGPAIMLIKGYLKQKGLCDSFTGGLPSYGVFLLVLLLFLRRHHANQFAHNEDAHQGENESDQGTENINTDSMRNNKDDKQHHILDKTFSLTDKSESISSRTSSHKSDDYEQPPYGFINVDMQKDYGRRVAAKLLLPSSDCDTEQELQKIEEALAGGNFSALGAEQPVQSPMIGVIIVEFLGVYGEELQCGRHGFSVRDGGFRFEVLAGPYTVAHPQASDPLLIEDPVNVMNNVAKNCFNAPSIQRVFLEAHERFKSVVTRYSGRAGAALSLEKGGNVIDQVFGSSINDTVPTKDAPMDRPQSTRSSPESDIEEILNRNHSEVLLYRKNAKNANDINLTQVKKVVAGEIIGHEFRKVLHEMLLSQQSVQTSSDSTFAL